jgi:leucyl aminopeptidase (aminopeptidase T)
MQLPVLERGAQVCVERLGVTPAEVVTIVHNAAQARIAAALAEAAIRAGASVQSVPFETLTRHGEEPPVEVAEAMLSVDVLVAPTDFSLSHTSARLAATARGIRCATLPTVTEEIFARAIPVDYGRLERDGDHFARLLTAAFECRITTAAGTDVTLDLSARHGRNDCARLSTPGSFGNLPAGEGYIAPVEHRGAGVIVFDAALAGHGLLTTPLSVDLREGRAVAAAGEAADWLLATLDDGGPLGRQIAELGIGTNPDALITGNILEDEKVAGTVHLAFGTSAAIGGVNSAGVHIDGVIRSPSLWLDGVQVLEAGNRIS